MRLPFLPISLPNLLETRFFQSDDSKIVRAGLWMMEAAWNSPTPGSIASDASVLMQVTRLTHAEWVAGHEVLLHGWCLEADDRLHHPLLERLASSVAERFDAQLAVIADSAVLACQGGEVEFELLPAVEVAKKRQTGKTAFPKNFTLDKATLVAVIADGYTLPEHRDWLVEELRSYALSEDRRQKDWQATLRNTMGMTFVRSKFAAKFGHQPGCLPAYGLQSHASARDRLSQIASRPNTTFAQVTANRNSDLMAQALERNAARGVPSTPVEAMTP